MKKAEEKLACELYVQGMSVAQIAAKLSCTEGTIYKVLRKYNARGRSVYPNLSQWLKDNDKSQECVAFDLDMTQASVSRVLLGGNTTKNTIDKILAYTGMTYEQCFAKK